MGTIYRSQTNRSSAEIRKEVSFLLKIGIVYGYKYLRCARYVILAKKFADDVKK